MSIAEPIPPSSVPEPGEDSPGARPRRSAWKQAMHWIRRGHLYLGLFLFPWAILYGVTAFLFNHPTWFADVAATSVTPEMLRGTPMEQPEPPLPMAEKVLAVLNERAREGARYRLDDSRPPTFNRELAFATVRTSEGQNVGVALDARGFGGTIRAQPPTPQPTEAAPFAIGAASGPGSRGTRPPRPEIPPSGDGPLRLSDPLHERIKETVPVVLERAGFPTGNVTVTSVPDLVFFMEDSNGQHWRVTANPQTGTVAGVPAEHPVGNELSVRRFLTRLHLAHGYPASGGVRWWWAVIVDSMAFVMIFWGLSGLLMWWQLKATRGYGLATLFLSALAATLLAVGMYRILS